VHDPLSVEKVQEEIERFPNCRFVTVPGLIRTHGKKFLDSSEAIKHYSASISSRFLETFPSGLMEAAISKFDEALSSQLALWKNFWGQKSTVKPGCMEKMSMMKIRDEGISLKISGPCVLQFVDAWNLPSLCRIEKTKRNKDILQDIFLDYERAVQ
jgi:hypothetical protein